MPAVGCRDREVVPLAETLAVEAAAAEYEQLEALLEQLERGVQVAGAKRNVVDRRHAYILSRP